MKEENQHCEKTKIREELQSANSELSELWPQKDKLAQSGKKIWGRTKKDRLTETNAQLTTPTSTPEMSNKTTPLKSTSRRNETKKSKSKEKKNSLVNYYKICTFRVINLSNQVYQWFCWKSERNTILSKSTNPILWLKVNLLAVRKEHLFFPTC